MSREPAERRSRLRPGPRPDPVELRLKTPAILAVCTGNVARSPMAECMLRAELAGVGLEVRSAGTRAQRGSPMASGARRALAEIGVECEGFESQKLTAEVVAASALILTSTRSHRADVLEVDPSAVRRVFTLREFARLVSARGLSEDAGGLTIDDLVARIAMSRSGKGTVAELDDDIVDPYGLPLETFRTCRDAIGVSVAVIAPALRRCILTVA